MEHTISNDIGFMKPAKLLQPSSLLLYLDMILLGFTVFTLLFVGHLLAKPEFVFLTLVSVLILAAMRARLPTQKLLHKIIYTAVEGAIILLPTLILNGELPFFPLLGLAVVIRSCQMFKAWGRILVASLTFVIFALTMLPGEMPAVLLKNAHNISLTNPDSSVILLTLKLNSIFSFGLAILFNYLLINALLEERQVRTQLTKTLEQLRLYALRIEDQSALQERNRIAREIHDSLGHTLTAQSIQIDSALFLLDTQQTGQARQFLTQTKGLCKQALQEVRQSVTTLRNNPREYRSLETVTRLLVKEFQATTAIDTDCMIQIDSHIPAEIISSFHRILQEVLTNIIRHSEATSVSIQLLTQANVLQLTVKDNGRGFKPDQNCTGFGLQGMRERTTALGGEFSLISGPAAGCLLSIKIPLIRAVLL